MNWFKRQYNTIQTKLLLRKLKKVAEPPTDKKLIYTDKNSNKYYCLKNPSNIMAERALTCMVYIEDIEYGLTKERRQHGFELMKECINKEGPVDRVKLGQIIGALETAESLYCNEEVLINLATVYVTMNGERFDTFADYEQKAKREIWDKDPDAKSFFLQFAHSFQKKFSEQPKLNVPAYLKEVKPVFDQISSTLTPLLKDSSS